MKHTSRFTVGIGALIAALFVLVFLSGCATPFSQASSKFSHEETVSPDGSYTTKTTYESPKELNMELERDPETGRVVGAKIDSRQNSDLAAGAAAVAAEANKALAEASAALIGKIPSPVP